MTGLSAVALPKAGDGRQEKSGCPPEPTAQPGLSAVTLAKAEGLSRRDLLRVGSRRRGGDGVRLFVSRTILAGSGARHRPDQRGDRGRLAPDRPPAAGGRCSRSRNRPGRSRWSSWAPASRVCRQGGNSPRAVFVTSWCWSSNRRRAATRAGGRIRSPPTRGAPTICRCRPPSRPRSVSCWTRWAWSKAYGPDNEPRSMTRGICATRRRNGCSSMGGGVRDSRRGTCWTPTAPARSRRSPRSRRRSGGIATIGMRAAAGRSRSRSPPARPTRRSSRSTSCRCASTSTEPDGRRPGCAGMSTTVAATTTGAHSRPPRPGPAGTTSARAQTTSSI